MSRDCPAVSPDGLTCARLAAHAVHAGLDEDGHLHYWSDDDEGQR